MKKPVFKGEAGGLSEERVGWEIDPQQQVELSEALPDKAQNFPPFT